MGLVKHVWTRIYELFGKNDFLMTVVGSSVVTTSVFWLLCGFFLIVDVTGKPTWIRKYKTQPDQNNPIDKKKLLKAVRVALFNQFCIGLPLSAILFVLKKPGHTSCRPEDLPPAWMILRDLAVSGVLVEIGFYYSHRLIHYGPLYKRIHKQHHEWTAPVGVISVYAHPVEFLLSNIFPFLLGTAVMKSHLYTTWLWTSLGLVTTIVHHSGYHLPLMPSPEFHDYHHLKFHENFGVLGFLDWLHGTSKTFRDSVQAKRDQTLLGTRSMLEIFPENKHAKKTN